jgi:hypothetical protein
MMNSRLPTGDWNVPTREEEAKMHYWILGIFFVVFSLALVVPLVLGAISYDSFKPGDVSNFTLYENNDSFYIDIPALAYESDFTVTNALVNITGGEIGMDFKGELEGVEFANITDKIDSICSGADCYYLLINATSLSCSTDCSNNNNAITRLGDSTWMLWSNHGDGYEINRAKTLATMWWGQANDINCPDDSTCDSLMNSGDAVDVSAIYSPDPRDTDKRYYLSYSYTQTSSLCNLTGTFDETTGNTAITPQSIIWGTSGADQISIILNGTTIMFQSGAGTLNEMGADLTADEVDNPTTVRVYTSDGGGGGGASNKWYMVIGSNSSITWSQTGSCGTHYEQDFLGDFGIPRITNDLAPFQVDVENQFDFSSALTTAMESCSGDPCPVYFNLTSTLWGNMTLHSLMINVTTAPTIPTTIAPLNNSAYFNNIDLTCSGSTDPDGDSINITFVEVFTPEYPGGATSDYIGLRTTGGGDCAGTTYSVEKMSIGDQNLILESVYVTKTYNSGRKCAVFLYEGSPTGKHIWNATASGSSCYGSGYDFSAPTGADTIMLKANTDYYMVKPYYLDGTYYYACDGSPTWTDTVSDNSTFNMTDVEGKKFVKEVVTSPTNSSSIVLQNSSATSYEWDASLGADHYWYCQACDSNGVCSNQTDVRTVTRLEFDECSGGNVALNFTAWDEEDDTIALNDTIDMSATIYGAYDILSYSISTTAKHETNFCLNPSGHNVTITGFAQYLPNNVSYSFPRQYYMEALEIDGDESEDIKLYSLTDALSTAVTFIASRAGSAVPNILIHLQRFDAGTGLFSLIATGKTSSAGTDVIYLRLTDAFYRVIAYESPYTTDELVYDSGTTHITSSPYTMLLSGGSTGQTNNWYDTWNAFGSIAYSLTFNESGTNAFLLVADDSSGATTSMCLKVDKFTAQGGQQNVCYDCATTSSVSISCIIPDTNSYYTAKFIANQNSDLFQAVYGFAVDLTSGIGELIGSANGAFFTFLLVGVSAFMALYSPMASVVLAVLAFGLGWAMGLLQIDMAMIMVLIAFASIVIATMYKRRSY